MSEGIQFYRCARCGDATVSSMEALICHMNVCAAEPLDREVARIVPVDAYSDLRRVFDLARAQAAEGKGKERHALPGERFEQQPIMAIGRRHGSNHFELGQAEKKLQESARLKPGAAKREILGAINYAAAAYLLLEEQEAQESVLGGPQASEG